MPKVENIEKKIEKIEGFKVNIMQGGKNVRSDASLLKQYEGVRMTRNSFTVAEYRDKFKKQYAGYDVDVLKENGEKATGQMQLGTVRDTYLDD